MTFAPARATLLNSPSLLSVHPVAQIAQRLKVPVKQVKNVIIWGNHSKTQYPDVNHAFVMDFPKQGGTTPGRVISVCMPVTRLCNMCWLIWVMKKSLLMWLIV